MSGSKQHYIPQCFQRPFKIESNLKEDKVWCYRKGKSTAFPNNIADNAAEKYFYSEKALGDEKTLDDLITVYEGRLGHLLKVIRGLDEEDTVCPEVAAEVIAHLSFRSKSIRHLMNNGIIGMVEKMSNLMNNGLDVKDFPAAPIQGKILAKIMEGIREHPEASKITLQEESLARIAYAYARENSDTIIEDGKGLLKGFLEAFKKHDIRNFHAKSFKGMFPEKVFTQLSEMKWSICKAIDGQAILPDCIGIVSEDGETFTQLVGGTKTAQVVIVPITPYSLLIGTADVMFNLSIDLYNKYAACCSDEFFISSTEDTELQCLQKSIGGVTEKLAEETLEAVVNEFKTQYSEKSTIKLIHQIGRLKNEKLNVIVSNEQAALYKNVKLKEIATKIVSRFGDENLNKISSLHFDDQVQATQDYSKRHIAENKLLFWERVRSDGIVALLPCEKDSRLCELHINHQVFDFFAASDSEALGVEYLNKAESDLLLIPVFDRFDSDEYSVRTQLLVVGAMRSLKGFNRSLNSQEKIDSFEDMARQTREELIRAWDKSENENSEFKNSNQEEIIKGFVERMSYSMWLISMFVARTTTANIVHLSNIVCDSPEFTKWILLFDKDMRLAIESIDKDTLLDAGLIASAHFERLLFGIGIVFELDGNNDLRWEVRPEIENALPLPFADLLKDTQ